MSYSGIDYGLGTSNIDKANGIRYGVISQGSVMPEALDDLEMYYGEPTCPKCGNSAEEILAITFDTDDWDWKGNDYLCHNCQYAFDSSEAFSDEALGFSYDSDGYKLSNCLDSDIFVLASPFYTHAQFCSPCVPGAGSLDNPCATGPKTYALGHEWYENGKAPYAVYSVATGDLVYPESK